MRLAVCCAALLMTTCVAYAQTGPSGSQLSAIESACVVRGATVLPTPAGATIVNKSATTIPPRAGKVTRVLLRYEVSALGRVASYDVTCVVRGDGAMEVSDPMVAS